MYEILKELRKRTMVRHQQECVCVFVMYGGLGDFYSTEGRGKADLRLGRE